MEYIRKKPKKEFKLKPCTILRKYGYEYHLVEACRPDDKNVEQPCFMGLKGFALKSVNKIKKNDKK
jgi:hypothetical protein